MAEPKQKKPSKLLWRIGDKEVAIFKEQHNQTISTIITLYENNDNKRRRLGIPIKDDEDALLKHYSKQIILKKIEAYIPELGDTEATERAFDAFLAEHWDEWEEIVPYEKVFASVPDTNKVEDAITAFIDFRDMAIQFIKKQPLYYDHAKLWWMWDFDKKCWLMIDEVDLMNQLDRCLSRLTNTTRNQVKMEVLESLKRVARQNSPKPAPCTWVQFNSEIIDIVTGEVLEPTPEYMITNPIPWSLGESEDTPTMDKLFEEWVGSAYIKTLYEIIAYCTLADYPLNRIFCLTGSGSNGKSKYISLTCKFTGMSNVCSSDLDLLLENRFEIAKLYKKLLCTMGETNFSTMKKTSMLKRLTGRDPIGFEFKNKLPFDDMNYAKIIIATNSLPMTMDKTEGFYRRWLILDFPNRFSEKQDILATIPEQEYHNLARKSLRILRELLDAREFTGEGDIEARKEKYEKTSNPLQLFIDKFCDEDVNSELSLREFIVKFNEFLKKEGRRLMSPKEISKQLSIEGYEKKRVNTIKPNGDKTTFIAILGLAWSSSDEIKESDAEKLSESRAIAETIEKHLIQAGELGMSRTELLQSCAHYLNATIDEVRRVFDYLEEKGDIYSPRHGVYVLRRQSFKEKTEDVNL